MSKTKIFLSSTCYDLKALREHLREKIHELGHELLASEFSSFPVSPDLSTVENCKKVVREHADLLVLALTWNGMLSANAIPVSPLQLTYCLEAC